MILVYGTTASGKSNIAEEIAQREALIEKSPLVYLATMENTSDAAKERINWHKRERDGKGFYLVEEMYNPENIGDRLPFKLSESVVLLECVSNLVANVMFSEGRETEELCKLAKEISQGVYELNKKCKKLIVVTNNVFTSGKYEDYLCDLYMQLLGLVNRHLAACADVFLEVVAGNPYEIKK